MRHTQYGKPDGNQRGIVRALRKIGASVAITTGVGGGFVDLVVGFRKRNTLLELKRPGERLNEAERAFHDGWRGDGPVVVESEEEALRAIGALPQAPDDYLERLSAADRADHLRRHADGVARRAEDKMLARLAAPERGGKP